MTSLFHKSMIFVGVFLFTCSVWTNVSSHLLQFNDCAIEHFQLSHDYLMAWGDDLTIYAAGACANADSHLELRVNTLLVANVAATELWTVLHTGDYPIGQIDLCVTVVTASVYRQPVSQCKTLWLVDRAALDN